LEIFGLSWVNRAPVNVALTIAHSGPTLHFFPVTGGVDPIFTNVTQDLDVLGQGGGGGEDEGEQDRGSHPLSSELSD